MNQEPLEVTPQVNENIKLKMKGLEAIPFSTVPLKRLLRVRPQHTLNEKSFWMEINELELIKEIDFNEIDRIFMDTKNTLKQKQVIHKIETTKGQHNNILDTKRRTDLELLFKYCKMTPQEVLVSIENCFDVVISMKLTDFYQNFTQITKFDDFQINNPLLKIAEPTKAKNFLKVLFFQHRLLYPEEKLRQELKKYEKLDTYEEFFLKLIQNEKTFEFVNSLQPFLIRMISILEVVTTEKLKDYISKCDLLLNDQKLPRFFFYMKNIIYFCSIGRDPFLMMKDSIFGFKDYHDGILNIDQTLSNDKKLTLLDYIIYYISRNESHLLDFFKIDMDFEGLDLMIQDLLTTWSHYEPILNSTLLTDYKKEVLNEMQSIHDLVLNLDDKYKKLKNYFQIQDVFDFIHKFKKKTLQVKMKALEETLNHLNVNTEKPSSVIPNQEEEEIEEDTTSIPKAPPVPSDKTEKRHIPGIKVELFKEKNIWNQIQIEMSLETGIIYHLFIKKTENDKDHLQKLTVEQLEFKLKLMKIDVSEELTKEEMIQKIIDEEEKKKELESEFFLLSPRDSKEPISIKLEKGEGSFKSKIGSFFKRDSGKDQKMIWESKKDNSVNLNEMLKLLKELNTKKEIEENINLIKSKVEYLHNVVVPMSDQIDEKDEELKYLLEFRNENIKTHIHIIYISKSLPDLLKDYLNYEKTVEKTLGHLLVSSSLKTFLELFFISYMYLTPLSIRGSNLCYFTLQDIFESQKLKSDTVEHVNFLTFIASQMDKLKKNFDLETNDLKEIYNILNIENQESSILNMIHTLTDYVELSSLEEDSLTNFAKNLSEISIQVEKNIQQTKAKIAEKFQKFTNYYCIQSKNYVELFGKLLNLFETLKYEKKVNNWRKFILENKDVILMGSEYAPITSISLSLKDSNGNIVKTINLPFQMLSQDRTLSVSLSKSVLYEETIKGMNLFVSPVEITKNGLFTLALAHPFTSKYATNPKFVEYIKQIVDSVEKSEGISLSQLEDSQKSKEKEWVPFVRKLFIKFTHKKSIDESTDKLKQAPSITVTPSTSITPSPTDNTKKPLEKRFTIFGKKPVEKEEVKINGDYKLKDELQDITFGVFIKDQTTPCLNLSVSMYDIFMSYIGEVNSNSKIIERDISFYSSQFPVSETPDYQQIRMKLKPKLKARHMIIHFVCPDKKLLQEDKSIITTVYETETKKALLKSDITIASGCSRWMCFYLFKGSEDSQWSIRTLNKTLIGSKSTIESKLPLENIQYPKQVVVRVLKSNDLAGVKNNTSDPYVQLYFQTKSKSSKFKTKTISKNVNPEWNQNFIMPYPKDESPDLIIEIWDYTTSKFLGMVNIPFTQIPIQKKTTYKLSKRPGTVYFNVDTYVKGTIDLYFDLETLKDMQETNTKIFGVDLIDVMKRKEETGKIPKTLQLMFDILDKCAPDTEGIFRVPGKSEDIEALIKLADDFEEFIPEPTNQEWIHAIASTLKQYLRDMPAPLMTYELYDEIIKTCTPIDEDQQFIIQMSKILQKIPISYKNLLNEFLRLSKLIEEKASKNRMNAENLAIVLGVNCMRSKDTDPMKTIGDIPKCQKIFTNMVKLYPKYLE